MHRDPIQQIAGTAGLPPKSARAGEFGDEAFATQQGGLPVTPGLADVVGNGVVEGDDIAGVEGDDLTSAEIDLMNGTEAGNQKISRTTAAQQDEACSAEKSLGSAPSRVDIDAEV